MRSISESAARVAGQSFSRKYIALGRILETWGEIVGAEFAAKSAPVRLHYRKKKLPDDPAVAALDIAVSGAEATLLHYQKDLLLERINAIFGERWITDIRFVPSVFSGRAESRPPPRQHKPLTDSQKTYLSEAVEAIDDPHLKAGLEALGAAILTEGT